MMMLIAVDHCFVRVHNRFTGPDVGSDHYPIVADISVRE
jgi:hypothetical protein